MTTDSTAYIRALRAPRASIYGYDDGFREEPIVTFLGARLLQRSDLHSGPWVSIRCNDPIVRDCDGDHAFRGILDLECAHVLVLGVDWLEVVGFSQEGVRIAPAGFDERLRSIDRRWLPDREDFERCWRRYKVTIHASHYGEDDD